MPARGEAPTDGAPNVVVLTGSAHPALGSAVARELGLTLGMCRSTRFPDGEVRVEIDDHEVEGEDVVIVQPTPAGRDSLLELLLIADACKRVGAGTVFAVVPYFGYARQDGRKQAGTPLGVRVAAQILGTGRFERIATVDPHSDVLAASLDMAMDSLSAVPLLVEALASELPERDRNIVIVAPDAGAMRLAREYSRRLRAPVAIVHKVRTSGMEVAVERVAGDVRGRRPIIVDDMISTGATMVAAAQAVRSEGSSRDIVLVATHAVLTAGIVERLGGADLQRVLLTDTLAAPVPERWLGDRATVVSVAPLLAASIRRMTTRRHLAEIMLHP
jgi:ribose-phosphate pyrophosphokinase